jgi:hypothetical protein
MSTKRNSWLPSWRRFTWVILVINVLFLIWIIGGMASSSGPAHDCGSLDQQTCDSAKNVGTAIGVGLIVAFWAVVDVILGIIWLVTKPRGRACPACGTNVKPGLVRCGSCGFDFARAAGAAATRPQPAAPAPRPVASQWAMPAATPTVAVPTTPTVAPAMPTVAPAPAAAPVPPPKPAGPPAGWYDDPRVGGAKRWWDGLQWTEHTHAPAAVPVASHATEAVMPVAQVSLDAIQPERTITPVRVAELPSHAPAATSEPAAILIEARAVQVAMRVVRGEASDMVGLIESLPDGNVRLHYLSGAREDMAPDAQLIVAGQ